MIGYSNDETNSPYNLFLTNTQVLRLHSVSVKNSSANIKLSKTQLSNMVGLEGFLGRLFGPLLKTGLSLMKHVLKPLTKRVLIGLRLTAAASTTDAAIQKKSFGLSMTTLLISNEEMDDIVKIAKSLEDQIKMKQNKKKMELSVCY